MLALIAIPIIPTNNKKSKLDKVDNRESFFAYKFRICTRNKIYLVLMKNV